MHGQFNKDARNIRLSFTASNKLFGNNASGSPFRVYSITPYQQELMRAWDYSVGAGDTLEDEWELSAFEKNNYHLRVYAPNGFYREFMGDQNNPLVKISCGYQKGNILVTVANQDIKAHTCLVSDNSYKSEMRRKQIAPGTSASLLIDLSKNYNWYDLSITIDGYRSFEERFAGHVETGMVSKTDPLMGNVL